MGKTEIDWADESWNFVTGCLRRCEWCYAHRLACKFHTNEKLPYSRLVDPFQPAFHQDVYDRLDKRLKASRKPLRVFLGSMADIGGDWPWVKTEGSCDRQKTDNDPTAESSWVLEKTKKIIRKYPHHTFMLLTKNPDGLRGKWPRNVWVGTSIIGRLSELDRISILLNEVDCGVRWISIEPLMFPSFMPEELVGIQWVVLGSLTGPGILNPPKNIIDHARIIIAWCQRNEVPVLVKENMQRGDRTYDWPVEFPERIGEQQQQLL